MSALVPLCSGGLELIPGLLSHNTSAKGTLVDLEDSQPPKCLGCSHSPGLLHELPFMASALCLALDRVSSTRRLVYSLGLVLNLSSLRHGSCIFAFGLYMLIPALSSDMAIDLAVQCLFLFVPPPFVGIRVNRSYTLLVGVQKSTQTAYGLVPGFKVVTSCLQH